MTDRALSPETLAAQALGEVDPVSGALAPPITLATNYEQKADGSYHQARVYTRADNPTYEQAERVLARLEGTGPANCMLFASGMAAAIAVFQALLPGDHVVVARMLDGKGSFGFDASLKEYGDLVEAGIIDPTKVVRIALENAVSVASVLLLTEATMTEVPEIRKERVGEAEMPI